MKKNDSLARRAWDERNFIAAIAAIIISIASIVTQHRSAELEATVISAYSDPNITFKADDAIYSGSYSIVIHLYNNGLSAITPEDFITPLEITTPQDLSILSASLLKIQNSTITNISFNKNTAEIKGILINPNDEIIISIHAGLHEDSKLTTSDKLNFWPKFSKDVRLSGDIRNVTLPAINFSKRDTPSMLNLSWSYGETGSWYGNYEILQLTVLALALYHLLGQSIKNSLTNTNTFAVHNIHALILFASILAADSIFHLVQRGPPWDSFILENYIALAIYLTFLIAAVRYNIKTVSNIKDQN